MDHSQQCPGHRIVLAEFWAFPRQLYRDYLDRMEPTVLGRRRQNRGQNLKDVGLAGSSIQTSASITGKTILKVLRACTRFCSDAGEGSRMVGQRTGKSALLSRPRLNSLLHLMHFNSTLWNRQLKRGFLWNCLGFLSRTLSLS